jgi:DNA polymerase-3 subunit chi
LPGPKRAGELAKLLNALHRAGRRVVVWVEDEGRLQILDEYLWTYEKLSFLPHAIWTDGGDQEDEPIVLTSARAKPIRADVLVIGDGLPPGDWAVEFAEIHDLIPPAEAGEERRAFWSDWQEEHAGKG